ncbi:hypothetical protein [Hamadaea tsunoensis]|uniref:hypothetical protein n=1 Tax=Hamadaea tsunoensis TaxID=53368 RepID=UPI0012F87AAF|nr:hypothetical protein [Hamadaea tsunoensis]
MLRKLAAAAAVLVATAGCGLWETQHTQENVDKWTKAAVAENVEAAREQAARDARAFEARLPAPSAATTWYDSCFAGEEDQWNQDKYQFQCNRSQIWYVPVDGDLLALLEKVDLTFRPDRGEPTSELQNTRFYFAHHGKNADGLQLPKPYLVYYAAGSGHVFVDWNDPAFPPPTELPTGTAMTWPQVYRQTGPAVTEPKGHANVLKISVSTTYYTVAWPKES